MCLPQISPLDAWTTEGDRAGKGGWGVNPKGSLEKGRGAPPPIFFTRSNVSSGTRHEFRFSPSDESLDDFRYGFDTEFGMRLGAGEV
ncbi:MAG: hypothetical protein P1U77_27045 [Rubripirellula sp.]|nr:hypothetical protein [Rubripirellula sp.]